MTQLTNEKIAKFKIQAQLDNDEQTLILLKEIESLKKALGNSRSHFKKNQAIYGFHTKSMQGNAFANGVNVVRKLFPELPKLTIDKANQTISIYQEKPEEVKNPLVLASLDLFQEKQENETSKK